MVSGAVYKNLRKCGRSRSEGTGISEDVPGAIEAPFVPEEFKDIYSEELQAMIAKKMSRSRRFPQFQITSNPVDLPNGLAARRFDITRFGNAGSGAFKTFYAQKTERLKDVLDQGRLAPDTRMLLFSTAGGKNALISDQMAFHHIAEGTDGGKDWMAVF